MSAMSGRKRILSLISESVSWSSTLLGAESQITAIPPSKFFVVIPRTDDANEWQATSIIPIVAVGHEDLDDYEWAEWVDRLAPSNKGDATSQPPGGVARNALVNGLDLRMLSPHGYYGNEMRTQVPEMAARIATYIEMLDVAEKWPQFASKIVQDMGGRPILMSELLEYLQTTLVTDLSDTGKRPMTLVDLIGRKSHIQGGPGWS